MLNLLSSETLRYPTWHIPLKAGVTALEDRDNSTPGEVLKNSDSSGSITVIPPCGTYVPLLVITFLLNLPPLPCLNGNGAVTLSSGIASHLPPLDSESVCGMIHSLLLNVLPWLLLSHSLKKKSFKAYARGIHNSLSPR